MSDTAYQLDMTMMFAVHDALRRDLMHIARITSRPTDDPKRVLSTAVGWELFKTFLRVHHTAEDDAVWPAMQAALTDRPDDLAVLDALEAEHALIDPLLAGVDAALADPGFGLDRLGDLVDALATALNAHLKHEEGEGLALIDATVTPEQWKAFSDLHRARIGEDARRYLPWLLDGSNSKAASLVLGRIPEPLRSAYQNEWRVAYAVLNPWGIKVDPATN